MVLYKIPQAATFQLATIMQHSSSPSKSVSTCTNYYHDGPHLSANSSQATEVVVYNTNGVVDIGAAHLNQ